MSYASILSSTVAVVAGTAGITGGAGSVVDHQPRSNRLEDLKSFFGNAAESLINGWSVSRDAVDDVQEDGSGRRFLRTHGMLIRGHYAIKEASPTSSEETFQALVDAVHAAIISSSTIWVDQPELDPKTVNTTISAEIVSNVLMHVAELRFSVDERTVI